MDMEFEVAMICWKIGGNSGERVEVWLRWMGMIPVFIPVVGVIQPFML